MNKMNLSPGCHSSWGEALCLQRCGTELRTGIFHGAELVWWLRDPAGAPGTKLSHIWELLHIQCPPDRNFQSQRCTEGLFWFFFPQIH